jgi:hypothetical protein
MEDGKNRVFYVPHDVWDKLYLGRPEQAFFPGFV